ncbi:MAG: EAL domain-containing protein [Butyrivibrio sp.]|nr:EAL domain-containing protein [Butyrivibrio sp.]
MDIEMIDSMTYRIAGAIICITCLFYSTMMRKRYRVRSRLFTMLVIIVLIDSLTDVVSYLAVTYGITDTFKWIISYLAEMTYYFTHVGMMPVFVFYIITICGVRYRLSRFQHFALKFPIIVLELMLLSNPLTQYFFVIVAKFDYARGIGIYLSYAVSVYYIGVGVFLLIKFWYTINATKKIAMVYFLSLAVGGTLIQMLFPGIKCELMCEAIGLTGIMLMIEKDDDRTDMISMAYNRLAFVQDMKSLFLMKREFSAICLRLENLDMYRKIYGEEVIDPLLKSLASFFMEDGTETNAYHTAYNVFYIVNSEMTDWETNNLAEATEIRMKKPWVINDTEFLFDFNILLGKCPEQFSSVNDLFLLESVDLKRQEKNFLRNTDLNFLIRRMEVEKAIGRGIQEKSFAIYYHPVYQQENNCIKLAQVYLKLHDSLMGDIQTAEFMEVAENSGFLEELQLRTIEGVCRFLSSGVDKSDMQIDFVLLPIMSARMIKRELFNKISENIKRFNIDASLLAFVLKESDALGAKDELEKMKGAIENLGVRTYISDYEAGFLGINTIANIDFEGVILDMSKIFETSNQESAEIVLRNRTTMIRQLDKKIIISGIDNGYYYGKIKDVPYDYMEGNYLSREVTRNELQNKFWHGEHLIFHEDGVERVSDEY